MEMCLLLVKVVGFHDITTYRSICMWHRIGIADTGFFGWLSYQNQKPLRWCSSLQTKTEPKLVNFSCAKSGVSSVIMDITRWRNNKKTTANEYHWMMVDVYCPPSKRTMSLSWTQSTRRELATSSKKHEKLSLVSESDLAKVFAATKLTGMIL